MAFEPFKLLAAFHGHEIESFEEASAFVERLDLTTQNRPHWQMARQALHHAAFSEASADLAWLEFRSALIAEGWLG
jgi:hypothetical protein